MVSSHARVTSIKYTKPESVSQSVSAMIGLGSDKKQVTANRKLSKMENFLHKQLWLAALHYNLEMGKDCTQMIF